MRHHSRRARFTRCRLINGYFPALERIDAFLEKENPELEEAKIKRAMVLLFGEDPAGYVSNWQDDWISSSSAHLPDSPNPAS